MNDAYETLIYKHLPPQWKTGITANHIPSPIPYTPHIHFTTTTTKILKQLRSTIFYPIHDQQCMYCNNPTPDTTTHKLLICNNPIRNQQRTKFWTNLNKQNSQAHQALKSLPQIQQAFIMLGLLPLNNKTASIDIIQTALSFYAVLD